MVIQEEVEVVTETMVVCKEIHIARVYCIVFF